MTQPRLVLPGDTVMVTRRTLRRHHLFRPDPADCVVDRRSLVFSGFAPTSVAARGHAAARSEGLAYRSTGVGLLRQTAGLSALAGDSWQALFWLLVIVEPAIPRGQPATGFCCLSNLAHDFLARYAGLRISRNPCKRRGGRVHAPFQPSG